MTAENGNGAAATTPGAVPPKAGEQKEAQPPVISIVTQYAKDLSFENPKAPTGLQPQSARPEIQISVDVSAQQLNDEQFEVVLKLNATAKSGEETVFLAELSYGGVFKLANIPQESLQPLLMIECPRLLFPFARRIIADATRDGGFPPLMIDPIDFVSLYRSRLQRAQQQATAAAAQGASGTGENTPS